MLQILKKSFYSVLFLSVIQLQAQVVFLQETVYGGSTGAGFSTALSYGSGSFEVFIEPGSTIKKAWLFAQRMGYPEPKTITLNNQNFTFNNSLMIVEALQFGIPVEQCSPFAIDAIDVTEYINPATTTYNITIPQSVSTNYPCWGQSAFYLYILYENASLPKHHSVILLNNKEILGLDYYEANGLSPMFNNKPVGFAIFSDRLGKFGDGAYVAVNSNLLGLIGGTDSTNIWTGAGVKGHYYYQNNTLFGLDDDTPNNSMSDSDGLADISSYIQNYATSINFKLQSQTPNNRTNNYGAWFLSYSTPCDTFTTNALQLTDTLCAGDSIQLQASGGVQYAWWGHSGKLSDSTLANPWVKAEKTATYIVQIKNAQGCSQTEHVKLHVKPQPTAVFVVTPAHCGSTDGVVAFSKFGTPVSTVQLGSKVLSDSLFDNLKAQVYNYTITAQNGCTFSDVLTVDSTTFQQHASFSHNPKTGVAPLEVEFENYSRNMDSYVWKTHPNLPEGKGPILDSSPLGSLGGFFTFDTPGSYEVQLLAYNNNIACRDSFSVTIVVDTAELAYHSIIIPKVFSPNGDGYNDRFEVVINTSDTVKGLSFTVFNRWGETIVTNTPLSLSNTENFENERIFLWDGTTNNQPAPAGGYYFVLSYFINGEEFVKKGTVSLVR